MSTINVLTFITALLYAAVALLLPCEASVHMYSGDKFGIKGNAFVVHGGSEGIYSSIPVLNDSSNTASSKPDSFIRCPFQASLLLAIKNFAFASLTQISILFNLIQYQCLFFSHVLQSNCWLVLQIVDATAFVGSLSLWADFSNEA